jgi:hypothetical protein
MRFSRTSLAAKLVVGIAIASVATGCGSNSGPTAEQALQAQLKQANTQRQAVFPLAGRVTIDGKPPGSDTNVVILMLNDIAHPEVPLKNRPYTSCEPSGNFSFSTYLGGDGIAPGRYVATFAQLTEGKAGPLGPDQLKNLYNDPDKNKDVPEFRIDHKEPGRKDYAFDLKLAGKDAVASPGKFALTGFGDPTRNRKRNR